ncbi:related to 1-acyl-sn-glycerol-3-phosphate acyltransferase [Desulfotalea psychrophila LSv54]|uniref:Related to 1-acyl-sn-glycerol-3-phosphate acyltransferase n=2 Tax=Desulfotalea psychrophila TaxID=84980 RepID=Q6ARG0_DESPS|nr:related to 1-acyl-sn-glycerol-3-phosphate acyltransferase [Desulfotalea psychrophila LSv54]
MKKLSYTNSHYSSPSHNPGALYKLFPSTCFYLRFLKEIMVSAHKARQGLYTGEAWVNSSLAILGMLEKIGVSFDISGIEHLQKQDGPAVIIGNHMSALETAILPSLVYPKKPVTFVVKQSLLDYPVFKHVVGARNPIAVSRTNPRSDLKTVMTEGCKRIEEGTSIIVFPQTTRSHSFSATEMSSIGVKLAKKAGVPIIPLALRTDAWENGKKLKDFGKINITKKVYFAFGNPLTVQDRGTEEQEHICKFIENKLHEWSLSL